MAEITALTPSPPSMADQSVPASSSPQPLPSETPIPKSSLYGDRAMMGNPTLLTSGENSSSWESTPGQNSAALSSTATESASGAPVELPAATDGETNGKNDLVGQTERHTEAQEQQMSPSPELNPSPNLYPNVQVNQTSSPAPSVDIPPQFTPPVPVSNPAPSSQDSRQTEAQTVPQPEPAQNPEPNTPSTAKMTPEPPCTPSKTEPPAVLVQESSGSLVLPFAYSRPAPDTLSYLESASLMSGTLESLSGLGEDGSSVGSDSEINGPVRRTDKYGFLGGAQYSEGSEAELAVAVARQREMKWLDMFRNWDKWASRRFQKVKMRCRKGIPSSLRAKAWQLLSNSQELLESNPGKFDELEQEQGDPKWLDIIEKDLHRQFPFHEMFAARGGHGVGLVLLKQMLGSVDKLRELQGMYETMERLRNIPPENIMEEVLVQEHASSAQMLQPSPKVVSEHITPTIPSPTANNAPLPPCPETAKTAVEEDGKKKKKTKEDKKREKEEEKQKSQEKKEKEKTDKERMKKKEKAEKEKKKEKGGKKKDKGGGGETEEKNGATAAKDLA
ncbi:TBC1 domain family member 10B-like [Sinocyclocheilus anshuiensis]|uniref:TBC1 domain family member 10B-like n=1 Tax=Sinocyclocheilus anshuiensis TaxID=1608454 RepID=UPI0007B9472A|nr:PREDICTED: TBC1 domain family member 10B-like [Sinocyclocheilus anshuiensis]